MSSPLVEEYQGGQVSRGEERIVQAMQVAFGESFHNAGARKRAENDGILANALVRLVEDAWQKSHDALWEFRRDSALNLEYVNGNQWSVWSRRNKRIEKNPKRENKFAPKIVLNIMRTIVMVAVSRFMSTRAQILIMAASKDQNRVDGAAVAQRVIGEYEWVRQNMDEVLSKSLYFIIIMGNVFWKVEWDPEDGDPLLSIPPEMVQQGVTGRDETVVGMDEEGFPSGTAMPGRGAPITIKQGNVRITIIDPGKAKPDPSALEIEDCAYFVWDADLSPQAIYNTWDVLLEPTQRFDDKDAFANRDQGHTTRRSTVKVMEAHVKAAKFPDAMGQDLEFKTNKIIVVADGRLLEYRDADDTELPFIHIRCLRDPRKFMGTTWLTGLRGPQSSLNKTVSVVTQTNDLMGAPPWMAPNGSNVPAADRLPIPARWIRYDPVMGSFKPEMVQPPTVSLGIFKHLEFLKMIIQELSGQFEGGIKGGAPGGIESGIALEALAERDTTRLYITASEIGRGIEKWARMTLKLIQRYWGPKRTIAVTGKLQEVEVLEFQGSDVDNSFQVRVVPDSVIPQMKAAKFQRAMAMFEAGWISVRDARRMAGVDANEEMTLEQIQCNLARRENREAKDHGFISTPIEEMQLHDHLVHAEEHLRRIFSPTCVPGSPEYIALLSHAMWHIEQFNLTVAPPPPPMEEDGEGGPPPAESGEEAE